jgi:hypothetical protein
MGLCETAGFLRELCFPLCRIYASLSAGAQLLTTGTSAKFNMPRAVSNAPSGTFAAVLDYANHKVRKIVVTTLAGSTQGFAWIQRHLDFC